MTPFIDNALIKKSLLSITVVKVSFSKLFGTTQKLKSIRACYELDNAASYITATSVHYALTTGGRQTLISDLTDRTSTDYGCYTYTDPTPGTIVGPMFIVFTLDYADTGSSHDIRIGAITLTLTEN